MQEIRVQSLGREVPLEKGTATHSSIFAWRIPMDRGVWWASNHRVTKESDTNEWLIYIWEVTENVHCCSLHRWNLDVFLKLAFLHLASCLLDLVMITQFIPSSLVRCSIAWVCPSSSDAYLASLLCYSSPVVTPEGATGGAPGVV